MAGTAVVTEVVAVQLKSTRDLLDLADAAENVKDRLVKAGVKQVSVGFSVFNDGTPNVTATVKGTI